MKIRIFQPIVPEYRVALFDGLAERYGSNIEVWAAPGVGEDVSVPLVKMRYDYSHRIVNIGPFVWQRGLSLRGLVKGDVIVVNGNVRQLSSMLILVRAKLRGVHTIWWGHHLSASSHRIGARIRIMIMRLLNPTVLLFYTNTGVKWMRDHGVRHPRMFATGNTINQTSIKNAIASFDGVDRFKGKQGLLCCAVLRPKVKLDQLVRAMMDSRLTDTVLAVIGDGSEKANYAALAKACGVDDRVVWLGATRDQAVMAPWFLSAKVFVYPGAIGLSILHALSYGLPVIVHGNASHQMPEFEVMIDGKTGLCFEEDNVADLADKIYQLLVDEERRDMMSQYAKEVAYKKYSMSQMVEHYVEAIEATRLV